MKLQETDHSYYCSNTNFYVGNHNGENYGRAEYDTWGDFKEVWFNRDNKIDHDFNHCFRFDIVNHHDDEEDEEETDHFSLYLYFILQRKGIFRPVYIEKITEQDMPEIKAYLESCWNYLQNQWKEVSE